MTSTPIKTAQNLRKRAEEKLLSSGGSTLELFSPEDKERLFHELQMHQIELERQNEELRRAQEDLEASKSRYFDLYDLAPVCYLTLSELGLILEANLAAATMLGVVRNDLLKKLISENIFPEDQDDYYSLKRRLIETGMMQACDLRLARADGSSFWVHLKATPVHNGEYGITFLSHRGVKRQRGAGDVREILRRHQSGTYRHRHAGHGRLRAVQQTEKAETGTSDHYLQRFW
jgi:PAS domain S-box-containing protein